MRNVLTADSQCGLLDSVLDTPVSESSWTERPSSLRVGRRANPTRHSSVVRLVHDSGGIPYPVGDVVALDVETDGNKVHKGHRIFCFAYKSNLGERGFLRASKASFAWALRLFGDASKTIVMHNMKFEFHMFMAEGIPIFDYFEKGAKCHDTMMMSKVLNSTGWDHDLRHCAKAYLGRRTEDKDEIKLWLKENNKVKYIRARNGRKLTFKDAPNEVVQNRVMWDVDATLDLYYFFKPRVDATCPTLYETERELVYVCADMEQHGVRIDITRAKTLREQALKDIERIRADIRYLLGDLEVPRSKKNKRTGVREEIIEIVEEMSPASNAHLVAAFKKMGIELKYKTKPKKDKRTGVMKGGGSWAFDEYAMIRYVSPPIVRIIRDGGEDGWPAEKFYEEIHVAIEEHDLDPREMLPPLIIKWRELSKMVSTYYDNFIEDCVDIEVGPDGNEYGILHCKFNQAEAMTGRFSSSEPNLQNIPRIMGPRECFVTRKGRLNWHLDFSQVEMRMFVHFSRDEHMAAAIDKDIHLYVATRIYKKPESEVTKEQRKRAKGTGFGILYGSGAETQAETLTKKGLPTTVGESTKIVAAFHREFPSIKRLTNSLKAELARKGYIENPFGRRYYIPTKFGYKGLNYMCQGTPADLIKAAMVKIWKFIRATGSRVKMLMQVHDELVLEVPPVEVYKVIPATIQMMEDRVSYFVPITVDAEVTRRRWSEKQDPTDLGFVFNN